MNKINDIVIFTHDMYFLISQDNSASSGIFNSIFSFSLLSWNTADTTRQMISM